MNKNTNNNNSSTTTTTTTTTTRVTIPNNARKTIANIKEITKNHSEDDIYAMLKECSMDPNDTIQRLLHLDTFQLVKSKREKRKEAVKSRLGEDSRWKTGHSGRETRGSRGNNTPQHSHNDADGRKSSFTRKENGVKEIIKKNLGNPPAPPPVSNELNSAPLHHVEKALSMSVNEQVNMPNGNLGCGHDSKENIVTGSDSLSTVRPNATAEHALSSMNEKETSKTEDVSQPNGLQESKTHALNSISTVKPCSRQGTGPLAGAEEAASKLVKLQVCDSQHVIIPEHIHVPDAVRNVINFGSINASFEVQGNYIKNENIKNLNSAGRAAPEEATQKSSSSDKDASNATQAEHIDNQKSKSILPNVNHLVDTKVSSSATKDDQSKGDSFPAVGPPFPLLQTTPSYGLGFMPPMLANTLLQHEGFESQAHVSNSLSVGSGVSSSSSTPPVTQSAGVGPTSIAVSPQPIPLFHQPYPPNYIPYSHYFPPFYVPTMHQYYGQTAIPSPLPTSNVFPPQVSTTTALKHSTAQYKQGANAGNQVPAGVPSGNPSTSEDLMPTAFKDNNVYLGQQSEGSAVWFPTPERSAAGFPTNSFLNFPPQGHHGPFAVYHTLQPMVTPPPGLPLLQLSQSVTGQVEAVRPPSNGHHQS